MLDSREAERWERRWNGLKWIDGGRKLGEVIYVEDDVCGLVWSDFKLPLKADLLSQRITAK